VANFDLQIFTIVLRESLEAALIVGLIASVVSKQKQKLHPVIFGVIAAIFASCLVAFTLERSSEFFDKYMVYFDVTILLFSSIIMVQMVYWMKINAKRLVQETKESVIATESSHFQRLALFSTSFLVVLREGSETALYVLGRLISFPQSSGTVAFSFTVAIVALVMILIVAKFSSKILTIAVFFRVTGWILLVTVAGYLIAAVDKLSSEGILSFDDHQVWNLQALAQKSSVLAGLFHFLTGLPNRPTVSEILTFVTYWFFIFMIFRAPKTRPSHLNPVKTLLILSALILVGCDSSSPNLHGDKLDTKILIGVDNDGDSPLKLVGERLFRESRFSQYFFANSKGVLTKLPDKGDPVVEKLYTLNEILPNPYKGQSISCAACHFVDQTKDLLGAGSRAYTDFLRRSPIPDRNDGQKTTVRNSPNMVGMAKQSGMFLHNDGEFVAPEDLVRASFLGRNMGWLVGEEKIAIHHMAQVIRSDDGSFPTETGLASLNYRDLFNGVAPPRYSIPAEYRMDITRASDDEIFKGVVKLVGGYLRTLDYARDANGYYSGSPFDVFLRKNNLSLAPVGGETALQYSKRLSASVNGLNTPSFVTPADGRFKLHNQDFSFSEKELAGFKIFFGQGQCFQCHLAPDFTDHLFHNTGVSQSDYDKVHGSGRFAKLLIPTLAERRRNESLYLPASEKFPKAKSLMRSIPQKDDPNRADLGAWVVFANNSLPLPQDLLRTALCQSLNLDCSKVSDDDILSRSIAMVKTPTVRDLGQSQPYLHTGEANNIEDVIDFYLKYSALARAGLVRNADPKLPLVQIKVDDRDALTAFLKSLNEDYD